MSAFVVSKGHITALVNKAQSTDAGVPGFLAPKAQSFQGR